MKYVRLALCVFFVLTVQTLPSSAASNVFGVTIHKIATGWGYEGIYISTDNPQPVEGCTDNRFVMEANHPLLKEILAMMLLALNAELKVDIRVDGCFGNGMKLQALGIAK